MTSYLVLWLIAAVCVVRGGDWREMMLCSLVGFGVSVPIPDQFFYAWCIAVELLVTIGALYLRVTASYAIAVLSFCLSILHYLGYQFDGYPPGSPYHFLVKIAEHAEIAACAVFSKPFLGRPKHAATTN